MDIMDIKKIKDRKAELEESIKEKIMEFEYSTQTYVDGIDFDRLKYVGGEEELFVKLKVEIR